MRLMVEYVSVDVMEEFCWGWCKQEDLVVFLGRSVRQADIKAAVLSGGLHWVLMRGWSSSKVIMTSISSSDLMVQSSVLCMGLSGMIIQRWAGSRNISCYLGVFGDDGSDGSRDDRVQHEGSIRAHRKHSLLIPAFIRFIKPCLVTGVVSFVFSSVYGVYFHCNYTAIITHRLKF